MSQVVRPREVVAEGGEHRFERLLRCLLSVEADDGVGQVGSAENLRTASASSCALRRSRCASSSSGRDKDAALAKGAVHERAGDAFPA